jgi:hypothetical protein
MVPHMIAERVSSALARGRVSDDLTCCFYCLENVFVVSGDEWLADVVLLEYLAHLQAATGKLLH